MEMKPHFQTYRTMLLEWNEKMNLTAITDPDEIAVKHFADSLQCLNSDLFFQGAKVIDVGTGAGFPGLPLAMERPDLSVTLLDSLQKRIGFLDAVIEATGVKNAVTVHSRAEDGAHAAAYREQFDIAVARAVASLNVLCEYCLPYVKEGGYFIAMKGPAAEEELKAAQNAITILGGKYHSILNTTPDESMEHKLVIIKKVKKSPTKYPRKAGLPSKAPLI